MKKKKQEKVRYYKGMAKDESETSHGFEDIKKSMVPFLVHGCLEYQLNLIGYSLEEQ